MAWRRPGDKPLSEPMMVSLLTHIYINRPQWVFYPHVANFQEVLYLNISIWFSTSFHGKDRNRDILLATIYRSSKWLPFSCIPVRMTCFTNMHLEMLSANWQPFCPRLNVLYINLREKPKNFHPYATWSKFSNCFHIWHIVVIDGIFALYRFSNGNNFLVLLYKMGKELVLTLNIQQISFQTLK